MRKLRRFVMNETRILSREELASIEGSLDIHVEDYCTLETVGKYCLYSISNDESGHPTMKLGVCRIKQDSNNALIPYCS